MSDEVNPSGFLIGLAFGAIVGVAVGFLYAPKAGEETRALIKDRAKHTKEKAEDIIEEARERAKRIIADAKGEATRISEEGEKTVS
ncbi:YtxH domain-containing protein [Chloroflexota bacterium]